MAGPGGGGNGGGFRGGGGGSFGGFGGGSFGGGHHRGYHRPRFYGPRFGMFGFGPMWYRPYYGGYHGGGCLSGVAMMIVVPVVLLLLALSMIFSSVGNAFSAIANGGVVQYDEMTFQDYASEQYIEAFGVGDDNSEDNILLLFALDEERKAPYVIAWVGDNIHRRISNAFGNENTKFGQTVYSSLPENYQHALSKSLSNIVLEMGDYVDSLGLDSSFDYNSGSQGRKSSYLVNKSTVDISEATVNNALQSFTEITEIPIVISVVEAEDVFGKTVFTDDLIIVIISLGLLGVAIWLFVRNLKDKNQAKKNDYTNGRNQENSQDGKYNNNGYNNQGGDWYNKGF